MERLERTADNLIVWGLVAAFLSFDGYVWYLRWWAGLAVLAPVLVVVWLVERS